jgi:hypothetical protein
VVRSERLFKLGDSWFSAKSMLVERFQWGVEVEYFRLDGG